MRLELGGVVVVVEGRGLCGFPVAGWGVMERVKLDR